jgi:hypothetical protein
LRQAPVVAATIVSKRHLALARVIATSFREHHPDIPFFVLLADQLDNCFDPQQEAFELLVIDDLGHESLLPWCFRYGQLPLSYALTPHLLEYLLDRGFEQVIFIKQESLVLGRLTALLDCLPHCSIALTPHLLKPLQGAKRERRELDILLAGTFNGGLIGVRSTATTHAALAWWRSRLEYQCLHAVERGMHYEQRWLDLLPVLFDEVQSVRHPGANVGHWHLPERRIHLQQGQVFADGQACQLFRFSGFETDHPQRATRYYERLQIAEMGVAGQVFSRYHQLLQEAGNEQCRQWPYAWDHFDNGVRIPDMARMLYRQLGSAVNAFGDPFSSNAEHSFLAWLKAPVQADALGISRLWHALYLQRKDVMAAYPEPFGQDRSGLLGWIRNTGWQECGIDPALLPAEQA